MLVRALYLGLYFLPSIIALIRNHRKKGPICVGNLTLGWSGIGWIIFMIWALDNPKAGAGKPGEMVRLDPDRDLGSKDSLEDEAVHDGEDAESEEVREIQSLLREIKTRSSKKIRENASQALVQSILIDKRFSRLTSTLDRKLNEGELTHGRYESAARKVFESVTANLSIAASLMASVDGIDEGHIEHRLDALDKILAKHEADDLEYKTLIERRSLVGSQNEKISVLLSRNEVALTELDKLNAALAEMNIVSGRVPSEFNASIEEMGKLVNRVKLYDEAPVSWESPPIEVDSAVDNVDADEKEKLKN